MSARALSPLRSKLFPKSSPNPNKCKHERSESARTLIHESQRFRNKADGLYLRTPDRGIFFSDFMTFSKQYKKKVIGLRSASFLWASCTIGGLGTDNRSCSCLRFLVGEKTSRLCKIYCENAGKSFYFFALIGNTAPVTRQRQLLNIEESAHFSLPWLLRGWRNPHLIKSF